jgi:hypothetical protein
MVEDLELRRRHVGVPHQLLAEDLAPLDPRRVFRRPKDLEPLPAQRVRQPCRERVLRTDYHEPDLLFEAEASQPVRIARLDGYIGRALDRGSGIAHRGAEGVALPQAAFALPLTIVILRPFFRSIPAELEDAARIDGCSSFGFFWRVLLPLARPALATVSVLAVVTTWNAFLLPLVVLNGADQWTLPLGAQNFSTQYSSDQARILAFTVVGIIPAIVFYAIAERQLVGGLTSGAVKG